MNILHIYPTTKAIYEKRQKLKETDILLPTFIPIDNFKQKVIIIPNLSMVETLQRVLLLKEATRFDMFDKLKINSDLAYFFDKSNSLFKFFEELIYEGVNFSELVDEDFYIEFRIHMKILESLLKNYKRLLKDRDLTDKIFIPLNYQLNQNFIDTFDSFELHLDSYLNQFELSIIKNIARYKPFTIHMQTSKFNKKIEDNFLDFGMKLEKNSFVSFELQSKKIISTKKNTLAIKANIFSVTERLSQIPLLLESVQNMVDGEISPEDIAVILPDEGFKDTIRLYDKFNNFNFMMGFDYSKTKSYKQLDAIYQYWQSFSDESIVLLKKYGVDLEKINEIDAKSKVDVEQFFSLMDVFDLDLKRDIVEDSWIDFKKILRVEHMSIKEWLFLWLKSLARLTIDDLRGGKVSVMGISDTRGVSVQGVVIIDCNDGVVPSTPPRDSFLNSTIRKSIGMLTQNDIEAKEKQLYKRLIEEAKDVTIIYSTSNNQSPSAYLYELGLGLGEHREPNFKLLYSQPSQIINEVDPVIENFDAKTITWSATRLKTFLTCKRKYYYSYNQKLKAKSDDEINEGQFLHEVLEYAFKKQSFFTSTDEMKSKIKQMFDQLLETSSPKIAYSKLLWEDKLTNFIKKQVYHFKAGWRVVEREKYIEGEIGGLSFRGVVDRVDQTDTHTLMLDYKSGSIKEANREKNLEKLIDFQMSIYYELLKDRYNNIDLAFVELFDKGNIIPITLLKEKNELLHQTIGELKGIKEMVATRCEDVSHCQYCDFTLLCERGDYL